MERRGIALGNTAAAVAGTWLLLRIARFRPALDRLRDVVALVVLAAATSTVVSATVGVASLWLTGATSSSARGLLWFVWWSGDAIGVRVVAPLLLTWIKGSRARFHLARAVEAGALGVVLLVVTNILFTAPANYAYAVFPIIAWGALRFGPRGAASIAVLVTALAVWYTLQGVGPFAGSTPTYNLTLLQTFVAVLTVAGLVVAAATAQREQAAADLRASEARLIRAQETAHLGSWELDLSSLDDLDSNPLWWSDQVFRIFGFAPGEVAVSNELFFAAVHTDDRSRIQHAVKRSLDDGVPYFIEHRVIRPDGSERIVQEQSTLERDARGRPIRMVGTILDITERQHLEQQLRQAQKMEAVGRLAGGVAHDFNNALTVILAFAQLIVDGLAADDPARADAEEIRKAARHAADVTRQLLAFSRQQIFALQILNLNHVVAGMERMLQRLIGEDIELQTVLAIDLGAVCADQGQLEQIIANLAVNARDAMPRGGTIIIETTNADHNAADVPPVVPMTPGRYAKLTVTDTGLGMDPATKARVFEPFFTTKATGKGTGLGLATVYGIVKQSGGYVWVDSAPGQGTTFTVHLPRVEGTPQLAPVTPEPTPSFRGSETVLVVEDEDGVRKLICRVLEANGYVVIEAAGPLQAVRAAEAYGKPIHLLVTDVVMPKMSGPTLAETLVSARRGMRVLYVTGYRDDAIVRHGVLEPGITLLQKPFTPTVLARKVREVLEGS